MTKTIDARLAALSRAAWGGASRVALLARAERIAADLDPAVGARLVAIFSPATRGNGRRSEEVDAIRQELTGKRAWER